ncbi:peptidylprolyl isomerase [Plasticicumulans acidivorans]|uniref:Peptidyl-prolyl cis-trans isomerase n=1 Tax=Plasticicumulans acidivorans TaxID=886464 RepID=A0A317MWR4_9GAMM|nr:peptidylprolyl isomerase [Plasticicumulans acidivorans]PWV62238.1 peptidyl-prolyl cis-trans isomerase B (cyclophilin B) [Plasticicumulans acidivorans]
MIKFHTRFGTVSIELDHKNAPATAANFLRYAQEGFFEGTTFHRVIPGFMIQGGGLDADLRPKETHAPIENEADNGLKNLRGTLSMARTSDPHSATAQFFINVVDNGFLDHTGKNARGWGYCVFGRVVEGMDVADAIVAVPTTSRYGHGDVPVEPIVIEKVEVVE